MRRTAPCRHGNADAPQAMTGGGAGRAGHVHQQPRQSLHVLLPVLLRHGARPCLPGPPVDGQGFRVAHRELGGMGQNGTSGKVDCGSGSGGPCPDFWLFTCWPEVSVMFLEIAVLWLMFA